MQFVRDGVSWIGLMAIVATAFAAAPALGDERQADQRPRLGGGTGAAGVGFYRPHTWGIADAWAWNPTDSDLDLRVVFRFDDQPQRQFVREVWVPAQSRRKVELPVRYGREMTEDAFAGAETILMRADAELEYAREPIQLRLSDPPRPFTIITGRSQAESQGIMTAMTEVRGRLGLPSTMSYVVAQDVMRHEAGWEVVEAAALATAEPNFDAAQREGLRRWIESGGTLVVFANLVDNEQMQQLLGESWGIGEVDRLTLTSVRFDPGPDAPPGLAQVDPSAGAQGPTMRFERPVGMRRVIAPEQFETWLEVDGWPALLSRPIGHGRVVVAMADSPAWTDAEAGAAMTKLAEAIGGQGDGGPAELRRAFAALTGDSGQAFVANQVGYRIAPRAAVAGVLGLFLAVLVAGAVIWRRRGQLERLGPLGAGAAVLAVAVLLVMGQRERRQVEPTRASLQVVRALPGELTAPVTGVMGLYDATGRSVTIAGNRGGTAWPISTAQVERRLSRMHTTDLGAWHWPNLPLAAGAVQPADFTGSARLDRPLQMSLRYGPTGLSGTVDWPIDGGVEDALLATPVGNMRVDLSGSGATTDLSIDAGGVLPRGVYYARGVLGQAQQERRGVLEALLGAAPPRDPALLAWSPGLDVGIETDPPLNAKEQALWNVPLRIEPSEPGARVRVPWPLMRMTAVRDPDQTLDLSMLPIYDTGAGSFQEDVSMPTDFLARFSLPRQVRPINLEQAVVHLDMTAIGREIEIFTVRDGRVQQAATIRAPDGARTATIPGDLLEVDEAGGLLVGFRVNRPEATGAPADVRTSQMWTVRHFGLEVAGQVLESQDTTDAP